MCVFDLDQSYIRLRGTPERHFGIPSVNELVPGVVMVNGSIFLTILNIMFKHAD